MLSLLSHIISSNIVDLCMIEQYIGDIKILYLDIQMNA